MTYIEIISITNIQFSLFSFQSKFLLKCNLLTILFFQLPTGFQLLFSLLAITILILKIYQILSEFETCLEISNIFLNEISLQYIRLQLSIEFHIFIQVFFKLQSSFFDQTNKCPVFFRYLFFNCNSNGKILIVLIRMSENYYTQ